MKSIKSQSASAPLEWDIVSSPDEVYHNYNVVEVAATDTDPIMFFYDVDVYAREEYASITSASAQTAAAQNRADLIYLSMMTGVDLDG